MYYTVYKITNKINNKIYIGAHKTSNLNDDYMGSGKHLKSSQSKYGIENFNKEIIFRAVSSDIMYWVERMLVDEEFVSSDETYNLKVGGGGGFDYINANGFNTKNHDYVSISKLMREAFFNKIKNDEEFSKLVSKRRSDNMKEQIMSGRRIQSTFSGKTHSEETKKKIGEKSSIQNKGENNPMFGTMWIHNLDLKESKQIKKDEFPKYEILGWFKGRKIKFDINQEKPKHKCKKCGEYFCKIPDICSKHQMINSLISIFNFDKNCLGSEKFYREYNRIKDLLDNYYHIQKMSTIEIAKKYNISTQRIDSIFKSIGIKHRTKSEARKNTIKKG